MPPLPFNPFGKKDQQGQSGGKEGLPSGGGPPAIESSAVSAAAKPEQQLTPLEIAKNEIDTAFSPFMDELETQQNPEEPFFARFGVNKGEKEPGYTSAQHKEAWTDLRVLVPIVPNAEGFFFAITRQGPKTLKPKDQAEAEKIQDIIDQSLRHKRNSVGGFGATANLVIGYNPDPDTYSGKDHNVQIIFDSNQLPVPSDEEVIASIQASRELAHVRAEETQKPLRDAQEAARKSKESAGKLSDFLRNPPQPSTGEGPAAPPPQSPTGRFGS